MAKTVSKFALEFAKNKLEHRALERELRKRGHLSPEELKRLSRGMDDPFTKPRQMTGFRWPEREPSQVELAPQTQEIIRDLAAGDFLSAVEDAEMTILSAAVAYEKIFVDPLYAWSDPAVLKEGFALVDKLGQPPTEIKIPEGTKWTEGPCGTYVDLGLVVNYVAAQYCGVCTFNGAAPDYAPATDAEINFALTGGSVVGLWHKEPYGLVPGTWAYSGFGTIMAINPPFHEPWDSNIHGKYVPAKQAIPLHFGIDDALWFDPLNERLKQMGMKGWMTPEQMWQHIEDQFGPAAKWSRQGLWWRAPSTEKFPWWKYPPKPHPFEKPFAKNNKGSTKINEYMKVNQGFRKPPEKHVKEVKTKGERALWRLLSAIGRYSEVQDAAKALYKGLPLKLRKQIWKENGGREPRPEMKIFYIIVNVDKMDWGEGITHLVASSIDDALAAMTSHDNLFRSTHRKFTGRMLTRSAWNEMVEGHPELEADAPSVEKWLVDNGLLGK